MKNALLTILCTYALLISININFSTADHELPTPKVCIGFNPVGKRIQWGRSQELCPPNYAVFEIDDGGAVIRETGGFGAICCPLPGNDLLTNQSKLVGGKENCPEDYIMTGQIFDDGWGGKGFHRCTKINTIRYYLSDSTPALYWGFGSSIRDPSKHVSKYQIPRSLRFAVGRGDLHRWDIDGCIGYPWGSVLSRIDVDNGSCEKIWFRQFLYVGQQGDPPRGTPVAMLPTCNPSSAFDPDAHCQ